MRYYEASRGRTEVVSDVVRRGSGPVGPRVFNPKGTIHAVLVSFPSQTVCDAETLPLRTFPDNDFEREPDGRVRCTECVQRVLAQAADSASI